jgi:hypothetical protein
MSGLRKAAEMALERLESHDYWMDEEAIQALRQALAEPGERMKKEWERLEPMRTRIMSEAYDLADRGDSEGYNSIKVMCSDVLALIETDIDKAYTKNDTKAGVLHKEWVGLTHDEVNSWELPDSPTVFEFAQFVEAKLKEKNT